MYANTFLDFNIFAEQRKRSTDMRNKGKVHPFTSSSSPKDAFPVLKLLPAAILALVSVLSPEDREVLAYMIARSLKSTSPSFQLPTEENDKSFKKQNAHGHNSPALFDCDCFHCYTSYWFRWDASPNRELIHQAIETFEEHLNNGEEMKKSPSNGKSRRNGKIGLRKSEKRNHRGGDDGVLELEAPSETPENHEAIVAAMPKCDVDDMDAERVEGVPEADIPAEAPAAAVRSHKGFARKVLPDFMGIFSSRLWSLWSPNV